MASIISFTFREAVADVEYKGEDQSIYVIHEPRKLDLFGCRLHCHKSATLPKYGTNIHVKTIDMNDDPFRFCC